MSTTGSSSMFTLEYSIFFANKMAKFAVNHLVVDSGAFIKHAVLHTIGESVYTLVDVVNEVRDKATRERLQVLPYDLKFREPTPEAIKIVTEFARKTGDLRTLSATDIRVIALVYTLENEFVGTDHIRTQPTNKVQYVMPQKASMESNVMLPGFYVKKTKTNATDSSRTTSECVSESVGDVSEQLKNARLDNLQPVVDDITSANTAPAINESTDEVTSTSERCKQENVVEQQTRSGDVDVKTPNEDVKQADQPSDEDEYVTDEDGKDGSPAGSDDGDDEGWITPGNLEAMKQASAAMNQDEAVSLTVACITTDYAMQNVLIQMGLHVISINGMLIRRTTSKILRCYGCFKVMPDCDRQFCSHCGNATLSRVTVAYNDDGTIQYFMSRHKKFSTRGLRYSLPLPKGGKHAENPILCADQREAQKRTSNKSKVKIDVLSNDFATNNSPFAPTDIYSRSAMLGYNTGRKPGRPGQRSKNPNENSKHYGHRK